MFAVFLGIFALVNVAAFCYFFGIWISYLGLLAGEALVWILKRVGVPLSDMASVLIVIPIVILAFVLQAIYIFRRWKPIVHRFIAKRKLRKK